MFADEVNWKEVAAELWHGFRHLTPQKVWDWLTKPSGNPRLFFLVVVVPLILLNEHYHWFR